MEPEHSSKAVLRRAMRRRLAAVSPAEARRAAAAVAERALALPEVRTASPVLCCLSFGDELDTRPLIDGLLAAGCEVCLPRSHASGRRLTLHRFPCPLETLSFGLEQPRMDTPAVPPEAVGVALVVGLAFDSRGYRLGQGAGYFDRFFAAHPTLAVGLAYDFQLVGRLPDSPHDIPVDRVVTERQSLAAARQ